MSAVHARCIREESATVPDDPFVAQYSRPVQAVVTALQDSDRAHHGVLVCDLALDLLLLVYKQPTPGLRYAALEGVVYNLVEALAPKPVDEVTL